MNNREYSAIILSELNRTLSNISSEQTEKLVELLLSSEEIFCAGAGRSGFAVKGFAMRLMHLGRRSYVVGETCTPNITDRGLLLIASGSGATRSLVSHAAKAREVGAKIALITATADSPIAEMADAVVAVEAVSPKVVSQNAVKSVQPMGSLFEQSVSLYLDSVVMMLMERLEMDSNAMFGRHANME